MQSFSEITNKRTPSSFTCRMPFLTLNQQCQNTEERNYHTLWTCLYCKLTGGSSNLVSDHLKASDYLGDACQASAQPSDASTQCGHCDARLIHRTIIIIIISSSNNSASVYRRTSWLLRTGRELWTAETFQQRTCPTAWPDRRHPATADISSCTHVYSSWNITTEHNLETLADRKPPLSQR